MRATAAVLILLLASLAGLSVLSRRYQAQIALLEAVAEADAHTPPPDWDPHRLGFCVLAPSGDPARVHDALRRVRRLYPNAPVFLYAARDPGPLQERGVNVTVGGAAEECLRRAAEGTQVAALMDDRSWMLRPPPLVLEGTVGTLSHRGGDCLRPVSLLLSAWVRAREGRPLDCAGEHLVVDARLARAPADLDRGVRGADWLGVVHGEVAFLRV